MNARNKHKIKRWLIEPLPKRWVIPAWGLAGFILYAAWFGGGPDIRLLSIDDDKDTVKLSVAPDVDVGDIYDWASKECREVLTLPPLAPVPAKIWQTTNKKTSRKEYTFYCKRE